MGFIDENPQYHDIYTTIPHRLDPALGGPPDELLAGAVSQYRRKWDHYPVHIYDMRTSEEDFSLDDQGFQVVSHESVEHDFDNEDRIKSAFYKEVKEIVRSASGATRVHPYSHLVRRGRPEQAKVIAADPNRADEESIGMTVPSTGVHIDHSEAGAWTILQDNMTADEVSKLEKTRWAVINLWKPIKTVRRDPLCVCDSRSVADEDLVPTKVIIPVQGSGNFENVSKGSGFEMLQLKPKPEHKWYYTSLMRPDEALLLKIYDSKRIDNVATRVPHGSFTIPGTEEEETRESIEVRCLVFFEDQLVD